MLMNTQGPQFLWATNTNNDDAYVRNQLTIKIGSNAALSLLKTLFPSGNIDKEVIKQKQTHANIIAAESNLNDSNYFTDGEEQSGEVNTTPKVILHRIVEQCINYYQKSLLGL